MADRLAEALGAVLGTMELPVRLHAWDGSMAGPPGTPVLRAWGLYMAACAPAFESGEMGVDQVLLRRPGGGRSPLRRAAWVRGLSRPAVAGR